MIRSEISDIRSDPKIFELNSDRVFPGYPKGTPLIIYDIDFFIKSRNIGVYIKIIKFVIKLSCLKFLITILSK